MLLMPVFLPVIVAVSVTVLNPAVLLCAFVSLLTFLFVFASVLVFVFVLVCEFTVFGIEFVLSCFSPCSYVAFALAFLSFRTCTHVSFC